MRYFVVLFYAFTLLAFEARANDGELFATSYRAIPPGAAIGVRPWDDSEDNLELAKEIGEALLHAGYHVSERAPLVLSFSTRDQIGTWTSGGRRDVLELKGQTGRGESENARVQLNLFSSDQGGVLNRGNEPSEVVPTKYQLEMMVDHRDGVRYWHGEAAASLERSDGLSLKRSMVPVLIRQIGRTVQIQSFETR